MSFNRLRNNFGSLLNTLQDSDQPPTDQVVAAVAEAKKQLELLLQKWETLKKE
jgi:hypothetical protein